MGASAKQYRPGWGKSQPSQPGRGRDLVPWLLGASRGSRDSSRDQNGLRLPRGSTTIPGEYWAPAGGGGPPPSAAVRGETPAGPSTPSPPPFPSVSTARTR